MKAFGHIARLRSNNRLEFALARPTRKSDALLLAAQPERWASKMRWSVALLFLVVTAGGAQTPSRYDNGPRQQLEAARRAWSLAGKSSYSFTISSMCFCLESPVRVVVKGGRVTRAITLADEEGGAERALPTAEWESRWVMTIPELLVRTERVLKDMKYYSSATFDEHIGYPITLSYSPGTMSAPTDMNDGFSIISFSSAQQSVAADRRKKRGAG